MTEKNTTSEPTGFDPVYEHTRRETVFIIGAWAFFCVWVVGVSLATGYDVDPDKMTTVMGMPAWVFWGVGLPWLGSNAFIIWFALKFMKDDPLGEDEDEDAVAESENGAGSVPGGEVSRG